ncbi:hypothetical protein AX15_006781 [Amanita polypyramis BW_CC]|nr:hypothetical protein AX15_006781 [Amanita polypyramis BW_CC]
MILTSMQKRKRGLTPRSDDDDDGDSVLPATAVDDETPPPPERPLVRESVAFSSVTANIPTYQASLPPPSSSLIKYLPGQAPSIAEAKKKRTKRTEAFSAQTGRFRLQAYTHNSASAQNNNQLLQQQRKGPYQSLYRANKNTTRKTKGSSSRKRAKKTIDLTTAGLIPNFPDVNLLPMPDPILYPPGEQENPLHTSDYPLQDPNEYHSQLINNHFQPQAPPSVLPNTSNTTQSALWPNSSAKRPGFHNRMVTILIHDIRSGKLDRQLAEVSIPVRIADDPQDGFWADAKDLIPKLQATPSRIDGPAKVYTLRGKYRQYFLRVSANNVDTFTSANIGISADRTLDVVVETPLEIGVLPSSPRIPSELLPSSEVIDTSESSDEGFIRKNYHKGTKAQKQKKRSARKRQHSLSENDSSDRESEVLNKNSHYERMPQKKTKGIRDNGTIAMSSLDHLPPLKDRVDPTGAKAAYQKSFEQMRGYDSPSTDEDPSRLYDSMVHAVETIIQKQPDWSEYTLWRDGGLSDLIKACGFVQRMIEELVGELAPFRTKIHEIRKAHVLAALRIEQKTASETTEILKLLRLYGEEGTRYCDSRVAKMVVSDDRNKPYKQLKQLLRLLRNIHEEWKRDHGAVQSDTMGDVE